MSSIKETISNVFPKKKVLIVGDLVADQFLRGNISRVSREAPVFILRHVNTETVGGGAANAASNVASLGGTAIVAGVIGDDANGRSLMSALEKHGVVTDGVSISKSFQTTSKLRVLASQKYAVRQQVIRIDYENDRPVDEDIVESLRAETLNLLEKANAVILSDYGYGVAEAGFSRDIIRRASDRGIPVFVDSRNRLAEFEGATAATPNKQETDGLLTGDYSPAACVELRRKLGFDALLVTLGSDGMLLTVEGAEPLEIPIVGKDEAVDVTGAGDTVIAAFALGVASGLPYETAARIANHAGGIVVMKKATSTVTPEELIASVEKYEPALADESLGKAR